MHNKFETDVNKCFETQRPSENDRGLELLKNFDDEVVHSNGKYVTIDCDGNEKLQLDSKTF